MFFCDAGTFSAVWAAAFFDCVAAAAAGLLWLFSHKIKSGRRKESSPHATGGAQCVIRVDPTGSTAKLWSQRQTLGMRQEVVSESHLGMVASEFSLVYGS